MSAYLFGTGGSKLTFLKRRLEFINKEPNITQHFRYFGKKMITPRGFFTEISFKENDKIVYSFAHPYVVLKSFSRRNFFNEDWILPYALNGDGETFKKLKKNTLECYLNYGVDMFMFGNHFNTFYSLPNNVLFIKDTALNEQNIDYIKKWASLNEVSQEKISNRNSQYNDISIEELLKFEKIHGNWSKHYDLLPDVFTNEIKKDNYFYTNEKD